jgi:protein-L-isoaspartate(D-aspartate) O-methyltransferase
MGPERDNSVHSRGRVQVLALWLVLLALAMDDSPLPRGGLTCTGVGDRQEQGGTGKRDGEEGNSPEREGTSGRERNHPVFRERVAERERMVRHQIEQREVQDPNVLRAMRVVPRHAFVPDVQQAHAYEDRPLYIGYGQTISQPYIVAFMTEALRLDPNSVVLEIGTGSGYQAAVCAETARAVYTIEIVEPLATAAAKRLETLGYPNVWVRAGDGYYGWPEKGPFDAIIGTAAAEEIPAPLIEQLKKGGRMILPVGGPLGFQYLILVTKDEQGQLHRENVLPVLFVPMTGRVQQPDQSEESDH